MPIWRNWSWYRMPLSATQSLAYQSSTVPPMSCGCTLLPLASSPLPPTMRSEKPPKGSASAAEGAAAAGAGAAAGAADSETVRPPRRSSGSLLWAWPAEGSVRASTGMAAGGASMASSRPRRSPDWVGGRASAEASVLGLPRPAPARGRALPSVSAAMSLRRADSRSGNLGMAAMTVPASFLPARAAYSTARCCSSASGVDPYLRKISATDCVTSASSGLRVAILAKAERIRPLVSTVAEPRRSFSR
mmetsp:Transcript_29714/g.63230  ORF Transcript_29714/g.63230 Transcript_29714/m.63230 type:complete len:247 (+) Transcript_29714:724-1464(+)